MPDWVRSLIFFLVLLLLGYLIGPAIISSPIYVVGIGVGMLLFILTLTRFDFALMLILIVIPFSIQVKLGSASREAPVNFGLDDFFIFCLFITWMVYLSRVRKAPFVKNPLTWPFLAYLGACLISFIPMAISEKGSIPLSLLHLVKWYEYVFIYFVMVRSLETREEIVRFTYLQLGCCLLISVIQLMQIVYGAMHGATFHEIYGFTATFKSNGILGAYYLFFMAFIVSLLVRASRVKEKFFLMMAGGLMSFTLFYTFARSAYIGFVVSIVSLGFFYRKQFTVVTILLVALIPVAASKNVNTRIVQTVKIDPREYYTLQYAMGKNPNLFKYVSRQSKEIRLDASSMERLINWNRARGTIKENLLIGTGYWSGRFLGLFGFSTAHNFFLTTLLELGVLGLIAFLWLSWAIIFNALRLAEETHDVFYEVIGRALAAGYIGILVHCSFGETFEDFRLTGPLWMMCGIVFAAKRLDEEVRRRQQLAALGRAA